MDKAAIRDSLSVLKSIVVNIEMHRRGQMDTENFVRYCGYDYDNFVSIVSKYYKMDFMKYWEEALKICDKE